MSHRHHGDLLLGGVFPSAFAKGQVTSEMGTRIY